MEIVAHTFVPADLAAGHAALDFVNTVTARNTARPVDWLDSYDRLVGWALLAGLLDDATAGRLRGLAGASPPSGAAALRRATGFRESLHRVATALAGDGPVDSEALAQVEDVWKRALARTTLRRGEEGVTLEPCFESSGLDLVADRLALQAIDLLRAFPRDRTRVCLGTRCGWLFVDTSKSGRRVWCDMATCGNAAKSRRHYERLRRKKSDEETGKT